MLDALGEHNLAFAIEQSDGAHLAQVGPHRIRCVLGTGGQLELFLRDDFMPRVMARIVPRVMARVVRGRQRLSLVYAVPKPCFLIYFGVGKHSHISSFAEFQPFTRFHFKECRRADPAETKPG